MAAYDYTAIAGTGRTVTGFTEAESPRHARALIRERGLVPLSVDARYGADAATPRRGRRLRVGADALALFTHTLATLLHAGLPVDEALRAIVEQTDDDRLKAVLAEVRTRIGQGKSMQEALDAFPGVFDEVYRATVGAGEQTRHLPDVLERLGEHVQRAAELRQQLRLAMIYPLILVAISVLVVAGLLFYVVPDVVAVFEHGGQHLPLVTRMLIATSEALRTHGLLVAAAAASLMLLGRRASRSAAVRRHLAGHALRLPVLGPLLAKTDFARFARTLSVLLANGVDMLDALTIASTSCANPLLREALDDACLRVREGEALSRALARIPHAPGLVAQLSASGESSGELPALLGAAADALERDAAGRRAVLLQLVEPALIVTMGAIVLFVVLAILLPIFEMNTLV